MILIALKNACACGSWFNKHKQHTLIAYKSSAFNLVFLCAPACVCYVCADVRVRVCVMDSCVCMATCTTHSFLYIRRSITHI